MENNKTVSVIIAGAGNSTRFGQIFFKSKQFLLLNNKPLLFYSLEKFSLIESIEEVIIVTNDIDETNNLLKTKNFSFVLKVVPGGILRQDSVFNGFCNVNSQSSLVLIHDAARPLFNVSDVKKCIEKALLTGACVLASPVVDTLKKTKTNGDSLVVDCTLSRDMLYSIQTPQVISYSLLDLAYKTYRTKSEWQSLTDETTMIEFLGKPVSLVVGSSRNIKITYPEDLEIARGILREVEKNIYV